MSEAPPPGAEFSRMIGLWWGEQLTALRQVAMTPAEGTR